MMKKIIPILLVLLVTCGIVLYVKNSGASENPPAGKPHSGTDVKPIAKRAHIAGIDVSHHNGLKTVANLPDSIKFVYIKASQGSTFKDPKFNSNYELFSKKAPHKVAIGAYHFFEKEISADDQFKNLSAAVGSKRLDLPVVVDFEIKRFSGKTELKAIQNTLLSLLQQIEKKYHKKPLIYCSVRGYELCIGNDKRLAGYRIWLDAKLHNRTLPNAIIEQKKIVGMCNVKVDLDYADPSFLNATGR